MDQYVENRKTRILFINGGDRGSSGFIINELRKTAEKAGMETFLASASNINKKTDFLIQGNKLYNFLNKIVCRIDGSDGFHNRRITKKLLLFISHIKPNIIHIHTIHGHFLNMPMLLHFCKENCIKIVWTLHDCWTFTGKCTHFEGVGCNKWKEKCFACPVLKDYPRAFFLDRTKRMFLKKKDLFDSKDLKIVFVAPSEWLAKQFKQSFLANKPYRLINNGIDLQNNLQNRRNYSNNQQIVFFSAAYPFTEKKGISVISKLADELDKTKYKFIVAGLTKKESRHYSSKIESVGIIKNRDEMHRLYSNADYFLNPTFQDTFPTVNIESLNCGTPVITFNSGGSPEILDDKTGIIIEKRNYEQLKSFILTMAKHKTSGDVKNCCDRASRFSLETMSTNYLQLYKEVIKD